MMLTRFIAKLTVVVVFLSVTTTSLLADLVIEGDLKVPLYKFVELRASGAGDKAQARWKVTGIDKDGKPVNPAVRKWKDKVLFTGPPGTYQVDLLVIDFDAKRVEEADATVIIGEGMPPKPPPLPPPPPVPEDPLVIKMRAALVADTASPADKAKWLVDLVSFYTVGAKVAQEDMTIKTTGDLFAKQKDAMSKFMPGMALKGVRTVAQAELQQVLPFDPDAQLTPALRKSTADCFNRLAKCVEAIK